MKCRLTKLVVFLLLGAIVNVAVAWGCATKHANNPPLVNLASDMFQATGFDKVRERANDSNFPKDSYISIKLEEQGDGLSVVSVETQSSASSEYWEKSWEDTSYLHLLEVTLIATGIEQRIIFKGQFGIPMSNDVQWSINNIFTGNVGRVQTAVGWPIKSLFYIPSNSKRRSTNLRGKEKKVWHLPNVFGKLFPSTDELLLPYGMLWPGLAINTIFYASILWMLALVPSTVRRLVRRKRGRCITCGYDLRGTSGGGCPECGWRREESSS